MASHLPFRHPQFSDDAAWLPPWLQPVHSPPPPTPSQLAIPLSLQNVDQLECDNVLSPGLLLSRENQFNICRLHLSGDDSSPITLTPCEKVMHFDLHLSTDGGSSIISTRVWDDSQNDRLKAVEEKASQPVEYLHGPRETSSFKTRNDAADLSVNPRSNGNCSGYVCDETPCRTNNPRLHSLNMYDIEGTDCDDISDAVELSVAASEALVIHELLRAELIDEGVSTEAILEVALRVKQARVDGLEESLCCSKDSADTIDNNLDFDDSDMENVYKDVGLLISSLDNISMVDPSVSRVEDTPMTLIQLEEEREVQSGWDQNRVIHLQDSFVVRFSDNNLGIDKLKDLPNVIIDVEKLGNLARVIHNQGEKSDKINIVYSPCDDLKSPLQQLHSGTADMMKDNGGSSVGYQSRWLGGWTLKVGDPCGAKESRGTKSLCKMLLNETSYLSESADVAPDENSVVHYHHGHSSSSEIMKSSEACKTVTGEISSCQDVVKDSNSSFIDPLCSMVPCSISSGIGESSKSTKKNDNLIATDAITLLETGTEIAVETIQRTSCQSDEHVGRKESDKLIVNDVGVQPLIQQQTKSFQVFSMGLPGSSRPSNLQTSNSGQGEKVDKTVLFGKQNVSFSSSSNGKNVVTPSNESALCPPTKSDDHDRCMRLLSADKHVTCSTSGGDIQNEQPLFRSLVSCTATTNNEENHVGPSSGKPIQDHCEGSAEEGAEYICKQVTLASPLVLYHRRRRFKAPKLPFTDLVSTSPAVEQAGGSDDTCHNSKDEPNGQENNLSETKKSARKRVRFSDADIKSHPNKNLKKVHTFRIRSSSRVMNGHEHVDEEPGISSQEVKARLTNCQMKGRKKLIFQGLDFLLTGFSRKKEIEIEGLLRKHGGMILSDIPTCPRETRTRRSDIERLPVIICKRKLQTTRFLYGCAVNAFLLKVGWAYDSIKAGSVLPPDKYVILNNQRNRTINQIVKSFSHNNGDYIFDKVGFILHGTPSFCTKLAKVIKHGRGLVYKSLQWLVQSLEKKKISLGAIVVESQNCATRHLKKCASEQKIPVVPGSWILNSLNEGQLLPLQENSNLSRLPAIKVPVLSVEQDWSQEI